MPPHYLCIHAHFYQPPREDPFTGQIPIESGAAPYQNWNERIHAECYQPNAEKGNFSKISFNIGPTLCAWLESYHPQTLRSIIKQDRLNVRSSGVGNAIAQPYNHTILPLAGYQDKVTQVAWGIADFEQRFGRKPRGMWLPETAVDLETLQVLAEHGIEFTILAPWQAQHKELDVTQPYRVPLPGGRSLAVFFFDASLSATLSFNPQATINADQFVTTQLLSHYGNSTSNQDKRKIITLASDGELYGHHQPQRDHYLLRLLNQAASQAGVQPIYPSLWLKQHQPVRSEAIHQNTSWSCPHGVERWQGTCDCSGENGSWKTYLRAALNRLGQALDQIYLEAARQYVPDPWALRDEYIYVMLGLRTLEDLVWEQSDRRQAQEALKKLHLLLEAQRERQRMFTSCGWFFEDFDRIEPRNNLAYAAQALRLTRLASGIDLSAQTASDLEVVVSQHSGARGDQVFNEQLQRAEQVEVEEGLKRKSAEVSL